MFSLFMMFVYEYLWFVYLFNFTRTRYVVCQGFKDVDRKIAGYLFHVNDELNELKKSERDVIWISSRVNISLGRGKIIKC